MFQNDFPSPAVIAPLCCSIDLCGQSEEGQDGGQTWTESGCRQVRNSTSPDCVGETSSGLPCK